MTDLIPVTTWSRNRKHLARIEDLMPDQQTGGRFGTPLCDGQTYADIYDQDWLDAKRWEWFGKPAGSQRIVDMRPCKRCERAAAKLQAQT